MKILNQTYREVTSDEYFNKTPVSNLQSTSELFKESLIHVVQYNQGANTEHQYESMKITVADFEQKVYEAIQNTFKTAYWDTHTQSNKTTHTCSVESAPVGTSFKELIKALDDKGWAPTEVSATGTDCFVKHVFYDFDVLKRYIVLKDNEFQVDIDDINKWIVNLDCYFAHLMTFHTTKKMPNGDIVYSNISVNHDKTENTDYTQMKIEVGNKISNDWICPATGNLVVYGWLDSSDVLNNKAIPSAYCVLEAKINNEWEIISAQPVIPSKSITYVGFNVPVHKDLRIRARTGFTVGAKSGQFSNEQDGNDTLANSTPNGFKCMIFSNKDYRLANDTIGSETP